MPSIHSARLMTFAVAGPESGYRPVVSETSASAWTVNWAKSRSIRS